MRIKIKDILNINEINKMIYNFYQITDVPIAIVDSYGDFVCGYGWTTMCSGIKCEYDVFQSYCLHEYWINNNNVINEIKEISCLHGLKMYRLPVYIMDTVVANVFLKISEEIDGKTGALGGVVSFMESAVSSLSEFLTKTLERRDRENAIINNYEEMKVSYDQLISVNSEMRFKIWELEQIIQHEKNAGNRTIGTEQKKYIMETVTALTAMMETKDILTARHQRKVAYLACKIAARLKLNREQCEGIYVAALLHDIGKIGIPSEILGKADKLSELEFEVVKTHVHIGNNILKGVSFPWPVADIILQHHEKINGSGYPYGLKDEEICIEAKIIAVADVVESITAHRSYKPSLSMSFAMEEIRKYAGIYYEKSVVDACLKVYMNGSYHITDADYQFIHNMD
jgi:putative nucleotidyltransferase with HDIG domain